MWTDLPYEPCFIFIQLSFHWLAVKFSIPFFVLTFLCVS